MKKVTKIMAIALTIAICFGVVPAKTSNAKSIYFAGEYKRKLKGGDYYRIELNQYSSPEGKKVGNYNLCYYSNVSKGEHDWGGCELKKTGTNTYKAGKYRIKIYKTKLVLSKAGALSGSYKLKKRYSRP